MRKLTLIDVIVLLVVAVGILAIFFPRPKGISAASLEVRESHHLRGIHQGFLIFAEDNGSYFPGLDSKGQTLDLSAESRLTPLVTRNYLVGGYLVSLKEADRGIEAWSGEGKLSAQNFSYTLLQVPNAGGRRHEWRTTTNPKAVIVADRNTSKHHDRPRSLWSREGEAWRGNVVFNDSSTSFVTNHRLDLKYGDTESPDDNIFAAAGDSDAYMIRAGNE